MTTHHRPQPIIVFSYHSASIQSLLIIINVRNKIKIFKKYVIQNG